ncbi:MAG: DUF58 domain-containing protein [Thermoguttaceae bacterium]|nr:DUF58 domain-containing protein [Thermoguttaceae bacterium]
MWKYLFAVALLLVAVTFDLGMLAYAMYVFLGILISSRYFSRKWAESLAAQRLTSQTKANVGQTVAVVIDVENQGKLPVPWVLVEELIVRDYLRPPARLSLIGRRLHLIALGSGEKKTLLFQIELLGRGYFQIGPLLLETGDLFGLHRRFRMLTSPQYLLVHPDFSPLENYDITSPRPIGEVRITHSLFDDPTRICGVRPYQYGDPMRRIHWRATARTGELHSKVYEPSIVAGATIVLDFLSAHYEEIEGEARGELAVTMTASLVHALAQRNEEIGLITNGRDAIQRIRFEGWISDWRTRREARESVELDTPNDQFEPLVIETRRGVEQIERIFDLLGRLELSEGLPLPALLQEAAGRMPRSATVILIVGKIGVEEAIAIGDLRRSGFVVTVFVNCYHIVDFEAALATLLDMGVEVRQLTERSHVADLCRDFVLR